MLSGYSILSVDTKSYPNTGPKSTSESGEETTAFSSPADAEINRSLGNLIIDNQVLMTIALIIIV